MKGLNIQGLACLGARLSTLSFCSAFVALQPSSQTTTQHRSLRAQLFMSGRSIDDLLAELNSRGIQVSPTASRDELEDLLSKEGSVRRQQNRSRNQNRPTKRQRRREGESSEPQIDYFSREEMLELGRSPREQRRQRQRRSFKSLPTPIPHILNFSRATVRILPDRVVAIGNQAMRLASRKTRQILDGLVDSSFDDEPPSVTGGKRKRAAVIRERSPRQKLEDDTSQTELFSQDQLQPDLYDVKKRTGGIHNPKVETYQTLSAEGASRPEEVHDLKPPLHEVLSALNERNIAYSPIATREELEVLLRSVLSSETIAEKTSRAASRQEYRRGDQSTTSQWKDNTAQTRRKSSDSVRIKVTNTNGRAQTDASRLFQDRPGAKPMDIPPIIVDAVVENFSQMDDGENVIDVECWYSARDVDAVPRRTQGRSQKATRKRSSRPGKSDGEIESFKAPTPILENSDGAGQGIVERSVEGRGKPHRPIYSPYRNRDHHIDGLDQVGDYVAKAVDSFLWGGNDNDQGVASNRGSSNRTAGRASAPSTKRGRSGHWKDRMEEQFDYIMGIHQDGKYYNRWRDQEDEDDQIAEGTDALSYARGKTPRRGRQRSIPRRAPWEEEDSLLSLIFGVDDRPTSFVGSGSILNVLRTLLRWSALSVSCVCRWASVRGSLPNPIVLAGALSAILCSRPGSRVRNLVFSLVAIRAVGEVMHGYVYDDNDFWNPREDGKDSAVSEFPEFGDKTGW